MIDVNLSHNPNPDKRNRIAICMPCVGVGPHMDTARCVAMMFAHLGAGKLPLAIVTSASSIITNARDNCMGEIERMEAEGEVFDWLFWIDSDMVFPPETLLRLMSHGKAIIGCTYCRRTPPYDIHGKTLERKPRDISKEEGPIEVLGLPTGMLLVHRSVFTKFKKPYWRLHHSEETGMTYGEDYVFCAMAKAAGYKIWLDAQLSKEIGHIAEKTLFPEQDGWAPSKVVNG